MKRKSEVIHEIEPKIATLSSFLKEEILDVKDIDKDVDDFLDCYNKFVKYVTEVYDKKEKTSAAKAAHFILKFKELNRKAQFRLSISREKTKETKDAINKSHLTMQNLLYEALHLEKETNSCLEYKSLFEEIELVSMGQFKEYAPSNLQNATTEHGLTLNRLHWELSERKSLSTKIEEAELEEKRLLEEINKKNESYANISTHLKSVFESTQSLEDIFEMPMHHQEAQNDMAENLPEPLYVLYTHLRVHGSMDEHSVGVRIVEESDRIGVLVELNEGSVKLSLLFQWDSPLQLITVLSRLDSATIDGLSPLTKSLLESSLLLSELPGDHGSPLEAPWIRAKVAGGSTPSPDNGLPYLWCQRLCGSFTDISVADHRVLSATSPLDYPPVNLVPRMPVSRPLPQVIEDIRHRLRSRLQLVSEISALAMNIPKRSSHLSSEWSLASFVEFKASSADTSIFVSSGLATEQCFYFSATVRSSKYPAVVMPLWLVVPHNYPDRHCLIVLPKTVDPSGQQYNRALHLVEVEVNCYCYEVAATDSVLSAQLSRLFAALESLVEYSHSGGNSPLDQLFVGGKFPATKRPFKSHK